MSKDLNTGEKIVSREYWILLEESSVKKLFIYYVFLFIVAFIGTFLAFWFYNEITNISEISKVILFYSIPCSLLGSTIYYMRKLYKACIQNVVSKPDSSHDALVRTIGAKAYFYLRPLISVALAIIVLFGIYAGIFILTVDAKIMQNNFSFLCMVLSFLVGFKNGLIIRDLDEKGGKVLDSLFGGKHIGNQ